MILRCAPEIHYPSKSLYPEHTTPGQQKQSTNAITASSPGVYIASVKTVCVAYFRYPEGYYNQNARSRYGYH